MATVYGPCHGQVANKEGYKDIIDNIIAFSTKEEHTQDLRFLFEATVGKPPELSSHKHQFFHNKLVYIGGQFMF